MTTLDPEVSVTMGAIRRHGVYANSLFTMFQTASLAIFGFVFWLVAARRMSPRDVGAAAALLAAANLVNSISVMGMSTVIVRFFPRAADRSSMASSIVSLVVVTSSIVTAIYGLLMLVGTVNRDFLPSAWSVLAFGFLAVAETTNPVFAAMHVADSAAWRNAVIGLVSGATRLMSLVIAIVLGSHGSASRSFCIAAAVTLTVHVTLLRRAGTRIRPGIVRSDIGPVARFAIGSHSMTLIGGLPILVLPLIVASNLGRENTAYFVMTMTLAAFVFLVPSAIGQNVLAAASHQDRFTYPLLKKTVKFQTLATGLAVIGMGVVGPTVLATYGHLYRLNGGPLLWWLLASAPLVVANGIFGVVLLVEKRIARLVGVNLVNAAIVLLGCALVAHDLRTIGMVWLVGEAVNVVLLAAAASMDIRAIIRSGHSS